MKKISLRRKGMQHLKEDIQKKEFHNTYLLYGEEEYLVHFYRDKLKETILDGADEMNYSYFQGSSIDLLEVKEIAQTLPFFQEHRLIVMEDSKLCKNANDFADVIESVPDSTIFIFVEKEVNKRTKLYKYIQKNGIAVELNAMSDQETLQFVAVHLGKAGKKIRQNTAQYFLEQVDNSLLNIQNELEKLIAYTMGREEITKEDIDAVCSIQVTGQIFKMLDAVAGGKKAEAIRLYHDLLELKENPMSILYLLTRHFNILLQIKSCKQSGKGELAKKIGIPPFSVGKYQMQAKHFTQKNLKEMLTACIDTEYDFKRGNINDQIGVELLLTSFVQQAG